jgi:hypothetical protein
LGKGNGHARNRVILFRRVPVGDLEETKRRPTPALNLRRAGDALGYGWAGTSLNTRVENQKQWLTRGDYTIW